MSELETDSLIISTAPELEIRKKPADELDRDSDGGQVHLQLAPHGGVLHFDGHIAARNQRCTMHLCQRGGLHPHMRAHIALLHTRTYETLDRISEHYIPQWARYQTS